MHNSKQSENHFWIFNNSGEPHNHKMATRSRASHRMAARNLNQPENGKYVNANSDQFVDHNHLVTLQQLK